MSGVYANTTSLEECREELREVLEEWILFRVYRHLPLPVIDGIELTTPNVQEIIVGSKSGRMILHPINLNFTYC